MIKERSRLGRGSCMKTYFYRFIPTPTLNYRVLNGSAYPDTFSKLGCEVCVYNKKEHLDSTKSPCSNTPTIEAIQFSDLPSPTKYKIIRLLEKNEFQKAKSLYDDSKKLLIKS